MKNEESLISMDKGVHRGDRGTGKHRAATGLILAISLGTFSALSLGTIPHSSSLWTREPEAKRQDTTVSFARNIVPIIQRSCVECHGAAGEDGVPVVEEGLNMLTYDGLMAGSSYGKVVEAGNADESYLIELITDGDMPKEGDLLPPEEIQLIRRWINEGAKNN